MRLKTYFVLFLFIILSWTTRDLSAQDNYYNQTSYSNQTEILSSQGYVENNLVDPVVVPFGNNVVLRDLPPGFEGDDALGTVPVGEGLFSLILLSGVYMGWRMLDKKKIKN